MDRGNGEAFIAPDFEICLDRLSSVRQIRALASNDDTDPGTGEECNAGTDRLSDYAAPASSMMRSLELDVTKRAAVVLKLSARPCEG